MSVVDLEVQKEKASPMDSARPKDQNKSPSIFVSRDVWIATIGGLFIWAAFPPVGFSWLAWIAPGFWIFLARDPAQLKDRPLRKLYYVGFLHWLMMVQWVRLPHWSAFFGWLVLAGYLAIYVPTFVLTTRAMIRSLKMPSILAAPIAWVAVELLRGYMATGFSLMLLAHSQVQFVSLIQISDIFGAYGVSFVLVFVAACIERSVSTALGNKPNKLRTALPLCCASLIVVSCLAYGHWKLQHKPQAGSDNALRIALIQGVFDTIFDDDAERSYQAFDDYARLSQEIVVKDDIDLVIWPESMFSNRVPLVSLEEPVKLPEELTMERIQEIQALGVSDRQILATSLDCRLLVGSSREHLQGNKSDRYNAALWIDRDGNVESFYDKRHPVMFGEYVPFGDLFPFLYNFTPMGQGLTAGTESVIFEDRGIRLMPLICFENTVPHLVRKQIREQHAKEKMPDALVTITNDGWFWGSSLLDVHLACGVFRAVETRRPMLIAANTGFSAWISSQGKIKHQGARRQESIIAETLTEHRDSPSFYLNWGDLSAGICLLISVFGCLLHWKRSS